MTVKIEGNSALTNNSVDGENEKKWTYDGADQGGFTYDDFFSPLKGPETFSEWIRNRKQKGLSVHIADFFGSAVFLNDLSDVDSLTGVRLFHLEPKDLPPGYPSQKWQEITGDLYSSATWRNLRKNLAIRQIPAFDLVVARPCGGTAMGYLSRRGNPQFRELFLAAHWILINRAYALLSSDSGEMYLEIPEIIWRRSATYQAWIVKLKSERTLEIKSVFSSILTRVRYPSGMLRIRKLPGSPVELPKIEM